jgi:predicted AAA+ superfamily ATPase
VAQWLDVLDVDTARRSHWREEALIWALERASRSGRVAWQFAKDFAGRQDPDASA